MVLVFGFWVHREFYQYGLFNLLVVGGLVTFLVIQGFRLAFSGELPRGKPRTEMTFSLEEGDRILRNAMGLVVRPLEAEPLPHVGQLVRAKYETGPELGSLLILDGGRKFLADLTDEEAKLAGYRSAAELREMGGSRWHWRPEEIVAFVRFRRVGVRS